jgi:hypothetical protein
MIKIKDGGNVNVYGERIDDVRGWKRHHGRGCSAICGGAVG